MSGIYKLPKIAEKVDFADVFPKAQDYLTNTAGYSFGLEDVYKYVKEESDDFKTEKPRLINLDNLITDVVSEYANEKGIDIGIEQPTPEPKKEEQSEKSEVEKEIDKLLSFRQKIEEFGDDDLLDEYNKSVRIFTSLEIELYDDDSLIDLQKTNKLFMDL